MLNQSINQLTCLDWLTCRNPWVRVENMSATWKPLENPVFGQVSSRLDVIYWKLAVNTPPVFTARCTLVQSSVLRSHVVCLSVCLSVTLVDCNHIGWNSSKIISPLVSLGCSLFSTPTWRVCSKGNTPKFGPKVTHPLLIWASETFDRKLRPNGYR